MTLIREFLKAVFTWSSTFLSKLSKKAKVPNERKLFFFSLVGVENWPIYRDDVGPNGRRHCRRRRHRRRRRRRRRRRSRRRRATLF